MPKRAQILVWDMGPAACYSSPGDERRNYGGVGIVEVGRGAYDQHVMRGFVATGSASFQMTDFTRDITKDIECCDIGTAFTQQIWPRPHVLSGLGGGGIFFRKTRMPASYDCEIMLVALIATLPAGTLLDKHMYGLEGHIGRWPSHDLYGTVPGAVSLTNPVDMSDSFVPGNNLGQQLKEPQWGWGEEKVGFISTLDLKSIDQCILIQNLQAKDNPTTEDQAKLEKLMHTEPGRMLSSSQRDEKYARFREEYVKRVGLLRWDGVETASEVAARGKIASEVIKELELA